MGSETRAIVGAGQEVGHVWANLYVNARQGLANATITSSRWTGKTLEGARKWAAKQLEGCV